MHAVQPLALASILVSLMTACAPDATPGGRLGDVTRPGVALAAPEPGASPRVVVGSSATMIVWKGSPDLAVDRVDASGVARRVLDLPRASYGGVSAIDLGSRVAIAWFGEDRSVTLLVIDDEGAIVRPAEVVGDDAFPVDDPILARAGEGAALAFLAGEPEARRVTVLHLDADGAVTASEAIPMPGADDLRLAITPEGEPATLAWGREEATVALAGEALGAVAQPLPWDARVHYALPPSHAAGKVVAVVWTSALRIVVGGATSGLSIRDVPARDAEGDELAYFPELPWDTLVTTVDHGAAVVIVWPQPYHWPEAHGCHLPAPDRVRILAQIEPIAGGPGRTVVLHDWRADPLAAPDAPEGGRLVSDAAGGLHLVLETWRGVTVVPVSLD
ncbi:MAG: hypothetical protein IT385_04330 [Deltaproteobacteria bacterium]|nr:hypothetical protein [Deltaproteobacteria bacterium]